VQQIIENKKTAEKQFLATQKKTIEEFRKQFLAK